MMLVTEGNEALFRIDAPLKSIEKWEAVCLEYLETDDIGLKMAGALPNLWKITDDELVGPELYDDDHQYKVVKVDYENALIWLLQI